MRYRFLFIFILATISILVSSCSSLLSSARPALPASSVTPQIVSSHEQESTSPKTHTKSTPAEVNRPDSNILPTPVNPKNTINLTTDTTEPQFFVELASRFSWPSAQHRTRVQKEIKRLTQHPKLLEKALRHSHPYIQQVALSLQHANMPAELVLLPYIESQYNPTAVSHHGAKGLWQFMPKTAIAMGLKSNWWVDERLHPKYSSEQAISYLKQLNKRFNGDWLLALAAYNGGQGYLAGQIRRQKHSDFWSLKLKSETMSYIPKLLAMVEIVKNPSLYHMSLPAIEALPSHEYITLQHQLDLQVAAEHSGAALADIRRLNPAYLKGVTPPADSSKQYSLLLPSVSAERLKKALSKLPKHQQNRWQTYQIKPGDTLGNIALKYRSSETVLRQINQLSSSRITAGHQLFIPRIDNNTVSAFSDDQRHRPHTVVAGDNLWTIAKKYQLSIHELATMNGIDAKQPLKIGKTLYIRQPAQINYIVRAGDSLGKIAQFFDVSLNNIRRWNQLNGNLIRPGQSIKILR